MLNGFLAQQRLLLWTDNWRLLSVNDVLSQRYNYVSITALDVRINKNLIKESWNWLNFPSAKVLTTQK